MLRKKWFGLFAGAGLGVATIGVGCSSTVPLPPPTDAGETPADAGRIPDARSDRSTPPTDGATDGGTCEPQTVANPGTPTPAYKAYKKQAACTDAQINGFFTACVDDNATTTTCQAWENANTTCDDCLITPATEATWGPIVIVGSRDAPFNIAGCFGITLNEGTSVTGCGGARWAFDRCLRAACPVANCCADTANCTAAEEAAYSACRQAAADENTGVCKVATTDLTTKCAALNNDATIPILEANCPLGDTVTLQAFTVAVSKAFCGGATGDGGGGG